METMIDYQADKLASKIKHYLICTMGRTSDEANNDEFYRAFCYAIREEVMINWLATTKTREKHDAKIVYYLSMEYLPGRVLTNNISNICSTDLVRTVLKILNRKYEDVVRYEADPALGNGGLGRLASCFLDSLATHHYPAVGYGLRYQYGIFEQQLWNGVQVEAPDPWLYTENPWEFRRDQRSVTVKYCGRTSLRKNTIQEEVQHLEDYEEVRALPYDVPIVGYSPDQNYSVVTLRLWSTKESPRNFQLQKYNAGQMDQAAENTLLTDVLYPTDYHEQGKRTRIKQEFLLVSASLQDICRRYLDHHENFNQFVDKVRIQINDTHPTLAIPELIRQLNTYYNIPWKSAIEITQEVIGYTNHTILSEALEQWDATLMKYLLPRQYHVIERLNQYFCDSIRRRYPNDEAKVRRCSIIQDNVVRMANLAVLGSHKVNGVAKLHGDIVKNIVFKDFNDLFPNKFTYVTNGVTQRRWLLECNPELATFVTERIGLGWITDFMQIDNLREYAKDPASQEAFLQIKRKNKEVLAHYIAEHPLNHSSKHAHENKVLVDVDSIFDVQIKRFHEYKRQLMNILHIIMLYQEMKRNPDHGRMKRTFIFSGKAAASYQISKDIIRLICCVARTVNNDPLIHGAIKIAFIENYNVSKAELIIPAADISEQISTAGLEASGTGNMKLSINGALTVGTEDGANIEMHQEVGDTYWPFSFGASSEQLADVKAKGTYKSWDLVANNSQIMEMLETLRDGTFAQDEDEEHAFRGIYNQLMEASYGSMPDRYFVLYDLMSYYEVQKKVDQLYKDPKKWAEYCIYNMASMGLFNTDRAIKQYAEEIWGLQPLMLDREILEHIRQEYSEHDKCRIYR
jgi:starch phosphorylase